MAYATSKLKLWTGGVVNHWIYDTADKLATVMAASYITDAVTITKGAIGKGMRPGDRITVRRFTDVTDDTTWVETFELVVASVSTSTGAATALKVMSGDGAMTAATATTGAATCSGMRGQVTTESLTTAAGAEYTLTITNDQAVAGDQCFASVDAGASAGTPGIGGCKVATGTITITVTNLHASNAFDNTLKVNFRLVKQ